MGAVTVKKNKSYLAQEKDPFFDFVVQQKVLKLPTRPASPRCVAKIMIQRHGPELEVEFAEWLREQERRKRVATQSARPEAIPEEPRTELQRLQFAWSTGIPAIQQRVKSEVLDHPEWGIHLSPDGPELRQELPSSDELEF